MTCTSQEQDWEYLKWCSAITAYINMHVFNKLFSFPRMYLLTHISQNSIPFIYKCHYFETILSSKGRFWNHLFFLNWPPLSWVSFSFQSSQQCLLRLKNSGSWTYGEIQIYLVTAFIVYPAATWIDAQNCLEKLSNRLKFSFC